MRLLLIGGGAREHALAWKLTAERGVDEVICSPGNAGIARLGRCLPIDIGDPDAILQLATREAVDFTIVGPEMPLASGVADVFAGADRPLFGPVRAAARLESSKAFAKDFMARHGVPTAGFASVARRPTRSRRSRATSSAFRWSSRPTVSQPARASPSPPTGVTAETAVREAMVDRRFGDAGARIVIEACMVGPEASLFVVCDGRRGVSLPYAQDHKRAYDDDQGPNTGGMGAFAPSQLVNRDLDARITHEIVEPVLAGLVAEALEYRGVLYVGLMLTADGPKVVEFNVRFGDPEAQVVLPMIETDLAPVLLAAARGDLGDARWQVTSDPHVGVVLASGGYPGAYDKGCPITGLEAAAGQPGVVVFHAGTAQHEDRIVTSGGRVLTVVGRGGSFTEAIERAYGAAGAHRLRREARQDRHRQEGAGHGRRVREQMAERQVQILMGSDSDAPVMQRCVDVLGEFGVTCQMTVASAHRSPERVLRIVSEAPAHGVKLFVVGAGAAAHLAGVVAAHSTLPVIGVPIDSSPLQGWDALLATVQMPPGVPVRQSRWARRVPPTPRCWRRRSWRSPTRRSPRGWSSTRRCLRRRWRRPPSRSRPAADASAVTAQPELSGCAKKEP